MTALEAVIDWISDVNYHARHGQIAKLRSEGTGEWFLATEPYLAWLKSPHGKLWVNAMRALIINSKPRAVALTSLASAGAGKTVLA